MCTTRRSGTIVEVEKLWSRVWQWACLEDDIPNAGDYYVYDIAQLSFLIVRMNDGSIKAYRNSCLHRGRKLRTCEGSGREEPALPVPRVGVEPRRINERDPVPMGLPRCRHRRLRVARGKRRHLAALCVYQPRPKRRPRWRSFLGDLADHFTHLPFTHRYKSAHVAKIMPVNWKACQEAFMEAYHTVATHPTLMENLGDANSRYDAYTNYSRAMSPHAVPSPHLADVPRYERLADGKQFTRWRHPLSGFIYQRLELGRVELTDLDGNVSIFDDDGNWIDGPVTQADPHLCKWVGGTILPAWRTCR